MRALTVGLALWLASCLGAAAHPIGDAAGSPWLAWNFSPWAVVLLADTWIWYGLGVWRLSHEVGRRRVLSVPRILAFMAGFGVLVLALLSPVDTLGDEIFWVHMVQHLLLTLVAPPLLVWSRPAVVLLWAFPRPARKRVARFWNGVGLSRTVRGLTNPLAVWILFTGVFLAWHLPAPFQFALDHEAVHDFEHVSFFVTALMFWSVVIEPSHRLGYGGRLLFLVSNGVLTGFPGVLMILAPHPLYPVQALRSAEWGLSGLEDQQIAGSVMWVAGGFVYLLAGSWLFLRWLAEADRSSSARAYRLASGAALVLLPLLLAGCNDRRNQPAAVLMPSAGNSAHGLRVIRDIGCGNCHTIPGVAGADGVVGPPLDGIARRIFLAGVLRNTPDNMVLWLRTPQAIVPGNAMPDTGLSERDARDVAAYLASLD